MRKSLWLLRGILALVLIMGTLAPAAQASPALSGNVPMGSYVYEYLDKLDGMGLLKEMPPAARPYSRMQVAGWVLEMEQALGKQQQSSGLAKAMLLDLRRELAPELARISVGRGAPEPKVREWTFGTTSYDGDTAGYSTGRGTW